MLFLILHFLRIKAPSLFPWGCCGQLEIQSKVEEPSTSKVASLKSLITTQSFSINPYSPYDKPFSNTMDDKEYIVPHCYIFSPGFLSACGLYFVVCNLEITYLTNTRLY